MFYVYILQSQKDENLYTGYTNNLRRRLSEHNAGENRSTRPRAPLELLYYEAYASRVDAEQREQRLKHSAGARTALKRRITNSMRRGHLV